ncbi:MAG: hypothetical protein GKR90_28005 [Pseudomonadales bacterium]|nr:hypothetical protein [Pseudomonadales bacterium]
MHLLRQWKRNLSVISIEFRGSVNGNFQILNNLVNALPSLQVLGIADTIQDHSDIVNLQTSLCHKSLCVLKLCEEVGDSKLDRISSCQIKEITKLFKSNCKNFKKICYSSHEQDHSLGVNTCDFNFFSILKKKIASYSNCIFSNPELFALTIDFQCGSTCSELSLINCNIDDEKATIISKALQSNAILKKLILTANKIRNDGAISIAEVLPSCSIVVLDLSLNLIGDEGVKKLLSKTSDTNIKLSLFGNSISLRSIPISNTDSMKVLSVSTRLGDEGMAQLNSYFDKEMNLEELSLQSCDNSSSGLQSVFSMICKCAHLLSLTLIDCNIDNHGVKLMASYLKNCTGLHSLDLSNNKISHLGIEDLASALESCINLEKLVLNENEIGTNGALCLGASLSNCDKIVQIELNDNYVRDDGVKAIAKLISKNCQFKSLKLRCNLITDDGALSLAEHLKSCTELIEIDLSRNAIKVNGMSAIADSIIHCKGMKKLYLGHNNIGKGCPSLIKILKVFTKLVDLDISENKLKSPDIEAIANVLVHHDDLELLNLHGNEICDTGFVSLVYSLKSCKKLCDLIFSESKIIDECFLAFPYLLKHSSNLIKLDLSCNNLSEESAKVLGHGLKWCTCLQRLNVSHNKIRDLKQYAKVCEVVLCCNILMCKTVASMTLLF